MTSDAARRPRSFSANDKGSASPTVSELSADGSGTLRTAVMDEPPPEPGVDLFSKDEDVHDDVKSDVDVASSLSSSVASEADSDDDDGERSGSETYWNDLGGEAIRDELGWTEVVKQHDIVRTYASDEDDGGACPYVHHLYAEDDEAADADNEKEVVVDDVDVEQLDKQLDAIELEEVESVESINNIGDGVSTLDPLHSDGSIHAPPSVDSLDDVVDAVPVDTDGSEKMPHVPSAASADSLTSLESDEAVAVALSDGENVLSDDDDHHAGGVPITGMVRVPSWARNPNEVNAGTDADEKRITDVAGTPRARARAKPVDVERRKLLLKRLTEVRGALQLVQMEIAAKSASAQHDSERKSKDDKSETKTKLRAERAALAATLDNLAKIALQRAIELEAREDAHTATL